MLKKIKTLILIILLMLFSALQYFGWLPAVDNFIHDNVMVSTRPVSQNIIIVGIDERSLNEIGAWPWPRLFIAEAIERLSEMGAAAIGVNILYDAHGASPEYDMLLVQAAQNADGHLVLGGMGLLGDNRGFDNLFEIDYYVLPFDELESHVNVGFLNIIPDDDGILRSALTSMRYGDISVHSFPFEVYRTYRRSMGQEYNFDIPLDGFGQFPIRYAAGPFEFTRLSLWGVINEKYHPSMFRDAIVLIGPYAQGIGDGNFPTSVNRTTATFGIEIHANIIQNMLEGEFKQQAPWWLNLAALLIVGAILIFLFIWLKPIPVLIATLTLIAAQIIGARLIYDQFFIIMKSGDIILFLIFAYMSYIVLSILTAQNEKKHIQGLFGRFVAPEVVKQIIDSGAEISLGGAVRDVSVVFVDIRGFTAFSEVNPPETVVAMVNRYLGLTSRSIQENNGTIDKYIGDATMAIFNAPNDVPNHALCAAKAALAMKAGAVALREEILNDYGVDLQFGVGINSGPAVIGNMGSEFRMDYTAIGDTVNTAARLESNSQKGQIIISDATYRLIKDHVEVTDMGLLNVKNKAVGIQIYSLDRLKNG